MEIEPSGARTETNSEYESSLIIQNTTVTSRHPWPAGMFIQGGAGGLVVSRTGPSYTTAFVEAFPGNTFIRGEGLTVEEAEDAAWAKYQQYADCSAHEWESRGYRNGAGFCRLCNQFGSGVFTPEQLGAYCDTCGTPSNWSWAGDKYFCQDHEPSREETRRLDAVAGVEKGLLETFFDSVRADDSTATNFD